MQPRSFAASHPEFPILLTLSPGRAAIYVYQSACIRLFARAFPWDLARFGPDPTLFTPPAGDILWLEGRNIMEQIKSRAITDPLRRLLFLCLGLIIMAFGVAFSIKAGLGTSPISSVPYVTSEISGLSVGTTTIIMNFFFVLIQIAILRRKYDWFQVLQFPAAILFGFTIDVAEWVIAPLPCWGYLQAWVYCALGIVLIALGVSVEVMANLVTTAGEGTIAAAILVGQITKQTNKLTKKLEAAVLR